MDLAHVYIGPDRTPWALADAGERLYRKELIYAGKFVKHDASGRQEFTVDDAMLHHWADTFGQMRQAGVEVPVPIEHTNDPEKRRATVVDLQVAPNSRGVQALYAKIKFRDAEAEKLAASAGVSIYVPPKFTDGTGRTYYRPIRHVALTDYPVVPGLEGFQAIAASHAGAMQMSLQSLAEKMAIPVADKDDPTIESEIMMKFQQLQKQLEEANAEIAKLKGEGEEGEGGGEEPPAVAAGFLRVLRDNRKMKLDSAVQRGLLTPAARKKIEDAHCTDKALALSANSDADPFDSIMDTLEANGAVLSFREKSGPQGAPLRDPSKKPEKTSVEADAERRAEEAAKRRRR